MLDAGILFPGIFFVGIFYQDSSIYWNLAFHDLVYHDLCQDGYYLLASCYLSGHQGLQCFDSLCRLEKGLRHYILVCRLSLCRLVVMTWYLVESNEYSMELNKYLVDVYKEMSCHSGLVVCSLSELGIAVSQCNSLLYYPLHGHFLLSWQVDCSLVDIPAISFPIDGCLPSQ